MISCCLMLLSFHSLCSASLLSLITHTQRGIISSNCSSCVCSRNCVQQTWVLHQNYYGLDSEKIEIQRGNEGTQHIKKRRKTIVVFENNVQHGKSERKNELHRFCPCPARIRCLSGCASVCLWLPCLGNGSTNSSRQHYENLFVTLRTSSLIYSLSNSLTQSPASVAFFFASHLCLACVRVCYFRNELKLA